MESAWFAALSQWTIHDKDRMPELISRLAGPSSAGIMFGVGASAARLEADRKTQLNLRRISLLLLAAPQDHFVPQIRDLWEKLVELFEADLASSPSAAVKAELFMLCQAMLIAMSALHLAPLWPIINDNVCNALHTLLPENETRGTFGNLALLQACKLVDLLIALAPEEFQLHEWLYISDTVDAVYQPTDRVSVALSDRIAEEISSSGFDAADKELVASSATNGTLERRMPALSSSAKSDIGDFKAMTRDDFARTVLWSFLSQLSIRAYENTYELEPTDILVWRRALLTDILDLDTIVE